MSKAIKRLVILGSTGSIGRQTLQVVGAFRDRFEVIGLAAGGNVELLKQQIADFRPKAVYSPVVDRIRDWPGCPEIMSMEEMATHPDADLVVVATSGKTGLSPTLAAIRAGKQIALSNKETLVMAGEIVTREARKNKALILPVDSEHSAIWQCLRGEKKTVQRLLLTASGGPFLKYSSAELAAVTAEEALRHPTWSMGKKVTIDSATLMNKGMEVIEAHWLFSMPYEKIDVVIHPESIVHSMVEFVDGSVKAQLSVPDMRLPIQYALTYPDRWSNESLERLSWGRTRALNFSKPDPDKFPCLSLAVEAARRGGTYPAVLCAADEVAVELFLSGKLRFPDIPRLVEYMLDEHKSIEDPTIDNILGADLWAREEARAFNSGRTAWQ